MRLAALLLALASQPTDCQSPSSQPTIAPCCVGDAADACELKTTVEACDPYYALCDWVCDGGDDSQSWAPGPTNAPGSGKKKKKEKSFFEKYWNFLLFGGVILWAICGRVRMRIKRGRENAGGGAGVSPSPPASSGPKFVVTGVNDSPGVSPSPPAPAGDQGVQLMPYATPLPQQPAMGGAVVSTAPAILMA